MKRILRIIALLIALGTLGAWLGTDAHRGWTRTKVTIMEIEPVTGLEHPVQKDQFVMGVELLGAGLVASAVAGALSFFFKGTLNKQPGTQSETA